MHESVDGLMAQTFAMIRGNWCLHEDTVTFVNHQVVALCEEMGESAEHPWDGAPLYAELADVVIVANMISMEVGTGLVALRWADAMQRPSTSQAERVLDVAVAVGKVAKVWRQISGQRRRASSEPFTLLDMDAALTRVVTACRAVPPRGSVLPLAGKLQRVLSRGLALDSTEKPASV